MDKNSGTMKLIERIQAALKARGTTVATAESCTGGLLATWLTELPGSSDVYVGGVSSYANSAKIKLLGVDQALLDRHGAVSSEVAEAMAKGARSVLGAQYAVSLTGIAGPGGGSAEKPVGTVYCGIASPKGVQSRRFNLSGDRSNIRTMAANGALQALLDEITI